MAARRLLALACGLAALAAGALGAAPEATESVGVVVESVPPGTTAARAGLVPGDAIASWQADPATRVPVRTPFDLIHPFTEELPRRSVTLEGTRGGEPRSWVLPGGFPSPWQEIELRPALAADRLALYRKGQEDIAHGQLDSGLERWRQAAAGSSPDADLALWFSVQEARALGKAERFSEADLLYHERLAPREAHAEGDPVAAQLLREWGDTFRQRRIWDLAENIYRRALALDRKSAPRSLAAARSLVGLGSIASLSGGAESPAAFFRQALEIVEALAPASADAPATWQGWGADAASDDDWATAAKRYRRAIEIEEKAAPASLYLARQLTLHGAAELFQGHLEAAESLGRRALGLAQKEAPAGLVMVGILQGLGNVATQKGDLPQAQRWLLQALALLDGMATDNSGVADLLTDLGLVERRLGKSQSGAEHLCRAIEVVERYRKRLEAQSEARLRWGFWFAQNYGACADALFDLGQNEKAFDVVERGRARSFLNQLAERDVRSAELPAPQAARWAELNAAYDALQLELARQTGAPKRDPPAIWRLQGKLLDNRRRKERILADSFPDSLPLAARRAPEPLDLDGTRRALDPGTVLLTFSTYESRTLLFAVRPAGAAGPGFAAWPIAIPADELAKKVALFRDAIQKDRFNRKVLTAQGKALYDLLLRPAQPWLAEAERVLIVPDGALHVLPFAALVHEGGYLVEWKPLHFAVSATAYREIQKRRRPPAASGSLVAFGNPLGRPGLPPLPAGRAEVEAIARLFPGSRVYLGDQASERQAKALGPDARFIHFAVHGLLDERNPLNSALALSATGPDGGNGLLQAWEVMEDLHLDADLVTLSACDSALGRDAGGEGLIGLTRAFQYAGARSVLAALWGVADPSTAVFMSRFYENLRTGLSLDQALRKAQIQQIRGAKETFPFFWAAFQLYGSWVLNGGFEPTSRQ
jgi:CHAT domain-containing protein